MTDLRKIGIHPDFWYPLARSRDLARKKTLGVAFAGEPIVLVRTESGVAFALEDRCAHRQVPLRAGEVCGEQLQCCYHGWTYDHTGRCTRVPYLAAGEALPPGVRSYPCREAYGLVFVFPGDAAKADSVPFPEIPSHADRRYKTRVLDRDVACHYSFLHENLMDMNHQHLHRGLMGRLNAALLDTRSGDDWIEVDYTFDRSAGKQNLGEKMILGRRDSSGTRARDVMTIRTGYPYQTLQFRPGESTEPALDLWNCYVPLDAEQRTSHQLGLMMIRKPGFPGLIHLMWPFIVRFTEGIFAEDRWIMEEEQKAFDAQGVDWNREISAPILGLREVLRARGVPRLSSESVAGP
jgi:phenylpropionate dioxygenase-like ring-hydroxylating dioxygenase large terminal subunit